MANITCSSCGKEIPKDSSYCLFCGKKVVIPKPPRTRRKKEEPTILRQAEITVGKSLKFSQHMAQFSKFVSFIFVAMFVITWIVKLIVSIKIFIDIGEFSNEILDFILSPVSTIILFYFSSKTLENISQGIYNLVLKKVAIENSLNSSQTNDE